MIIDPLAKSLGDWAANINIGSIFFRIMLSIVLAVIVGCERSTKRHSAGLRTFMILTLGSTIIGMLDSFLMQSLGFTIALISSASIIAFAILSSNSILFTSKNQIRGLTTSVTLWVCGALGLCFGLGFYTAGLIGFAITLLSISVFPKLEIYLKNRSNHFEIYLELKSQSNLSEFISIIRRLGLKIDDIEVNPAYFNSGLSVYMISLTIFSDELKKYKTHSEIIKAISSLDYVNHIEEM